VNKYLHTVASVGFLFTLWFVGYKGALCLLVLRKMYIVKFVYYFVHKGQPPFLF